MLTAFWEWEGVIHMEFLQQAHKVNSTELYTISTETKKLKGRLK